MVDTGAAPNLIKQNRVNSGTKIDTRTTLRLTGITDGEVRTLGKIQANVHGRVINFHVIGEDFPIPQDGILGADFLSGAGKINFVSQVVEWHDCSFSFTEREMTRIPARSRAVSYIRVANSEIPEGYVPRLHIHDGVYLGDAIVSNRDGKAYLCAINSTLADVEFPVPTVELEQVNVSSNSRKSQGPNRCSSLGLEISTSSDENNGSPESSEPSETNKSLELLEPRRASALGPDDLAPSGETDTFSKSFEFPESVLFTKSSREPSLGLGNTATPTSLKFYDSNENLNLNRGAPLGSGIPAISEKSNVSSPSFINAITESAGDRAHTVTKLLRLEHLSSEESEYVDRLIKNHSDIFHLPSDKLGFTNAVKHSIDTTNNVPIHTKQYRFPPVHKGEIDSQVRQLLTNDVIKPSTSPYNSPLWIVPKKADSKGNKRWRMVIDYRALNEKTVGDAYPLPNITEILDQLGSAKYFSVFDLASGFHQIQMNDGDAPKTAFSTPYGHYEFQRMPFGLKNAPATFQRLMDQVLSGLQGNELFVYLDDIVLYSSSLQEHETKFERLAARLRAANLKLQPDKCEFLRREVMYLGHIIGKDGVRPDPKKVEAVQNFPQPRNAKTIKQFLGLAGYYRRFIPGFSKVAKPLTELLKKETVFRWGHEQNKAFSILRDALCSEPLLQYPDFTKPFVVTTDASQIAIGGILSQGTIGKDQPIAYTSRLLNDAEQNYSTIERELLAIVYAVNHFRPYLFGRKFQLVTDHKPLVWLNSVKDPTSRLVRWRLKLAEYEYEVIYKAGKTNVNADALSRNPVVKQILPISSDGSIFNASHPRDVQSSPRDSSPLRGVSSSPHSMAPSRDTSPLPRDAPPSPNASPHAEGRSPSLHHVAKSDGCENATDTESDSSIEISSDSDSESADESDEPLFDPVIEAYHVRRANLIETRDNIATRRDNLVIFTTPRGKPCDEGARLLKDANTMPDVNDSMIGRAKVTKSGKRYVIALIVEDRVSETSQLENLKENVASLLDVTTELQLKTLAISKGSVIDVSWNTIKNLILREFRESNVRITACSNEVTVPPEDKRLEIIKENHDTPMGGHKGVTKTIDRIKFKYQWPKLREDVQRYVKTCRECQLKKLVRLKTRQPMVLTDTPGTAFEKVSMDIMGPLPTSLNGFNYILTMQDLLTKFSLAIPLRQATSIAVADALVNELICVFGAPRIILTDQGSNFVSSLLKNVARRFRIKQIRTTAYRPQSNGSVERSHQVLWEYLKQFAKKDNWDEYLKLATFSSNTSIHEGTRYTPYELVFGKTAETPSSSAPITADPNESYSQYLSALFNKLRDTQEIARTNLRNAKIRSKRYYDKKTRPREFNVGDYVYLLKEPLKNKLDNRYSGPYQIIERLSNHNVKLEISQRRHRIVHTDKIKLAHLSATPSNTNDARSSETPTPEENLHAGARSDAPTACVNGSRNTRE